MKGRVTLVGAGPGDPGLLTRRALAVLRRADLVLYDALVPAAIISLARRAKRFDVGKRHNRHAISQDAIHRLMIRGARRGQHVVRLKGGDPFMFGRGGEEVLAMRAAGIPVDVVPGVSSVIAAPELAGIPVTHRGVASAVSIVSGHAESAFGPVVDSLSPGAATLVVLMGLNQRGAIAERLIARGWSGSTPAAIVSAAGQQGAAVVDTRLPGTIVIGNVVALSSRIGGVIETAPQVAAPVARLSGEGQRG